VVHFKYCPSIHLEKMRKPMKMSVRIASNLDGALSMIREDKLLVNPLVSFHVHLCVNDSWTNAFIFSCFALARTHTYTYICLV